MARILTIILNYRTAEMTIRSAEAARRALHDLDGDILIVDNDSADGSFDLISQAIRDKGWDADGRMRVVESGRNGGFGAGNNFGIQTGTASGEKPDYIYVLNSDAFPDPNAIKALSDYLDTHPAAGFCGSYIQGEDGITHLTTFRFPSVLSEFEGTIRLGIVSRLLRHKKVPVETPEVTQPVDWLAGASVMMRRDLLEEIGLFDETFFLYFEETDLCKRVAQAGKQTVFVRESVVTHIGSVSTGMKSWQRVPDYWFASRSYYFAKNHGKFGLVAASLAHLTGALLHRLRCLVTGKKRSDPPHFLRSMLRHDLREVQRAERPAQTPSVPETRAIVSE